MGLFQKIGLIWKNRKAIKEASKAYDNIKEAYMEKPGYKTTEFWLVVVSNLLTVVGALKGVIPEQTAAIILASLNGVYGVLRTVAKKP